jgi:hypothetical protein
MRAKSLKNAKMAFGAVLRPPKRPEGPFSARLDSGSGWIWCELHCLPVRSQGPQRCAKQGEQSELWNSLAHLAHLFSSPNRSRSAAPTPTSRT